MNVFCATSAVQLLTAALSSRPSPVLSAVVGLMLLAGSSTSFAAEVKNWPNRDRGSGIVKLQAEPGVLAAHRMLASTALSSTACCALGFLHPCFVAAADSIDPVEELSAAFSGTGSGAGLRGPGRYDLLVLQRWSISGTAALRGVAGGTAAAEQTSLMSTKVMLTSAFLGLRSRMRMRMLMLLRLGCLPVSWLVAAELCTACDESAAELAESLTASAGMRLARKKGTLTISSAISCVEELHPPLLLGCTTEVAGAGKREAMLAGSCMLGGACAPPSFWLWEGVGAVMVAVTVAGKPFGMEGGGGWHAL